MNKVNIKSLSKEELEQALAGIGDQPYRGRQIFRWLYKSGAGSFDEMTDIGKDLREKLKNNFHITKLALLDSKTSLIDGTTKYLFRLEDSNTIESVFLPETGRTTLCLSSQVGCKFGCSFCASAPFGFIRNLLASEILDQVLSIKSYNRGSWVTNVVFMGIGEPLDNYDNVIKAIRILNDEDAFKIGARKITISTCGIIPGIQKLKNEKLQIELSVSLHSADNKARSGILPINKKYPLKDLMAACRDYVNKTKRIITFEYALIKGVNTSRQSAENLARILKGMACKVNTISCNQIGPVRDSEISNGIGTNLYAAPPTEDVKNFITVLKRNGINVMHRKSKGEDINAGCGQLRIDLKTTKG